MIQVVGGLDALGLLLAGFSEFVDNFPLRLTEQALSIWKALGVSEAASGLTSAIRALPDQAFSVCALAGFLHCHLASNTPDTSA